LGEYRSAELSFDGQIELSHIITYAFPDAGARHAVEVEDTTHEGAVFAEHVYQPIALS
jgi:hypothetical protein